MDHSGADMLPRRASRTIFCRHTHWSFTLRHFVCVKSGGAAVAIVTDVPGVGNGELRPFKKDGALVAWPGWVR